VAPSIRTRGGPGRAAAQRRVEISLEGFRRFERGDIDGLVALYDRQAELWHPEGWPEPGPTVGRPAVKRQFEALREGWTEHRVIVEQIDGRGDWVVARVRWQARGGESGVDVEVCYSAASRFEGDLIVEVHYCWDHEDAVSAAGWPARRGRLKPPRSPRPHSSPP
jgi:ketosteroid isomerase-like protein